MTTEPVRVAALGMGWWSDVLADAVRRTPALEIVACYTRSDDKRYSESRNPWRTANLTGSYRVLLPDP